MKHVVSFLVLAALAGGCSSSVDDRLEKADLKVEEAEQVLLVAREFGDPAGIVAAEAALARAREAVERAEEAAQREREARQAFWMGLLGIALAGVRLAAGLVSKGASAIT